MLLEPVVAEFFGQWPVSSWEQAVCSRMACKDGWEMPSGGGGYLRCPLQKRTAKKANRFCIVRPIF
jgi:hypothetical protein